ncbi:Putative protease [Polaromonas sp. CG9_12]|nr:Putative protease [Polaromonas sp. CG9_12]
MRSLRRRASVGRRIGHGSLLLGKSSSHILAGSGPIRNRKAERPDAAQALCSWRLRQWPHDAQAPELLSPPSGSLDKMRAAQDLGADAVYAGQPRYSMRARNNELRLEQIQTGIHEAHARGRKFFACGQVVQPGVDQSVGRPGQPRLQQRFPGTPTGAAYAKLLHRHL